MIGLITINDYTNFGNRLQNYAMWKILSKKDETKNIVSFYGCESKKDIFENNIYDREVLYHAQQKWAFYNCSLKEYKGDVVFSKFEEKRKENFLLFNKLIPNGEKLTPDTDFEGLNNKYDYFVTGSDQVFNPLIPGNSMYINMLGFAQKDKKIALSPSIALDKIPDDYKGAFKKYLCDFNYLSCREKPGCEIIKDITNKECTNLIDPVFMLNADEWSSIERKPIFHDDNKPYLLLYFLGKITDEYKEIINNISNKYGLRVINLLDSESEYYSCGPSEFLYLIHNCSIMLTDSFHGTSFSYIFKKPFRIFRRKDSLFDMNTRLVDLIEKLQLNEDVYIDSNFDGNHILDVFYNATIVNEQKNRFGSFLDKCLGGERK